MKLLRPRTLGLAMLVLVLAAAIYGFAAANTVPESGAGDGSGAISGYTISNISYTLNASTPSDIDSVQFDVSPTAGAGPASTVYVQLNGATWDSCTNTSGNTWSCTLSGVTAAAAANLRVVAAQ